MLADNKVFAPTLRPLKELRQSARNTQWVPFFVIPGKAAGRGPGIHSPTPGFPLSLE
jgi:hypothetical protein